MPKGTTRPAYVRRSGIESRVEDRHDPDAISIQDLAEVAAALTAWERAQAPPAPAKSSKPPPPRQFRRQYQDRIKLPLWILLARAAVAEGVAAGLIKRGGGDTAGWETQVLDGWFNDGRQALL